MTHLEPHAEGVVLAMRARGGGRASSLGLAPDGMLKVTVTQPPEHDKANQAIVALLRARLQLKRSQIQLLTGRTAARKKLLVRDISVAELEARIKAALAES